MMPLLVRVYRARRLPALVGRRHSCCFAAEAPGQPDQDRPMLRSCTVAGPSRHRRRFGSVDGSRRESKLKVSAE